MAGLEEDDVRTRDSSMRAPQASRFTRWSAEVLRMGLHLGTAALLFWALASHDYGFFQLLRVIVTASALAAAYGFHNAQAHRFWLWAFGACAVLFNPLAPVHLDRQTWAVIDIAAANLFISGLLWRGLSRSTRRIAGLSVSDWRVTAVIMLVAVVIQAACFAFRLPTNYSRHRGSGFVDFGTSHSRTFQTF